MTIENAVYRNPKIFYQIELVGSWEMPKIAVEISYIDIEFQL